MLDQAWSGDLQCIGCLLLLQLLDRMKIVLLLLGR